jgi:hypothetical protein
MFRQGPAAYALSDLPGMAIRMRFKTGMALGIPVET